MRKIIWEFHLVSNPNLITRGQYENCRTLDKKNKQMNAISVTGATLLQNFNIKIEFSDNTSKVIDFEQFLKENSHPQWDKYKNLNQFKKFRIENGNLIWGRNWDLIFPIYSLYTGNLDEPCC